MEVGEDGFFDSLRLLRMTIPPPRFARHPPLHKGGVGAYGIRDGGAMRALPVADKAS